MYSAGSYQTEANKYRGYYAVTDIGNMLMYYGQHHFIFCYNSSITCPQASTSLTGFLLALRRRIPVSTLTAIPHYQAMF